METLKKENKLYLVLEAKKEDGAYITEPCPFCGEIHKHGNIKKLTHRIAHCNEKPISFITNDGMVDNSDGYYLKAK